MALRMSHFTPLARSTGPVAPKAIASAACKIPTPLVRPNQMRFCKAFEPRIKEYEDLLSQNRIWLCRTEAVGILHAPATIASGAAPPDAVFRSQVFGNLE